MCVTLIEKRPFVVRSGLADSPVVIPGTPSQRSTLKRKRIGHWKLRDNCSEQTPWRFGCSTGEIRERRRRRSPLFARCPKTALWRRLFMLHRMGRFEVFFRFFLEFSEVDLSQDTLFPCVFCSRGFYSCQPYALRASGTCDVAPPTWAAFNAKRGMWWMCGTHRCFFIVFF